MTPYLFSLQKVNIYWEGGNIFVSLHFCIFSPLSKLSPPTLVLPIFLSPSQGKCGPERDIASGLSFKEETGLENRQHKRINARWEWGWVGRTRWMEQERWQIESKADTWHIAGPPWMHGWFFHLFNGYLFSFYHVPGSMNRGGVQPAVRSAGSVFTH